MGSEAEIEQISSTTVPKLPLLLSNIPQMQSPQHPGMLTPPLHTTTASVPFRWEEEPGKPRPCTALTTTKTITNNTTTDTTTTTTTTRCLELPPRLLTEAIITKMPSPTTVLEGPYMGKQPVFFGSSSFRFIEDGSSLFGSEKGQLGAMLLSKSGHYKGEGFFGSNTWGRRGLINFKGSTKRDVAAGEDSFVFSSSLDTENGGCGGYSSECGGSGGTKVKMTRIRRNGSFLGLSHARSHNFLATIYEGLKQAIPWGSRKLKKDNLSV